MPASQLPVALVTGASSGIGLATAQTLSRQGFHLVLLGRTEATLQQAAKTLEGPSTVQPADVGDSTQARAAIDRVADQLGRLDALINNAGYAPLLPIDQTTDAEIDRAFRVNAIGPAALISHAWPLFRNQQSGCVVNVSTLGTDDPFPGFFAYASSKASVNLMTRSCANEGAAINVRAFAVAPGAVETPMLRGLFSPDVIPAASCLSPQAIADIIADCVLGRRDSDNGGVIWVHGPASS